MTKIFLYIFIDMFLKYMFEKVFFIFRMSFFRFLSFEKNIRVSYKQYAEPSTYFLLDSHNRFIAYSDFFKLYFSSLKFASF